MIRLRARVFALCALCFLPLSAISATISVTTPFDIVRDDNLCSIREAVNASLLASNLNKRKGANTTIAGSREVLEQALLDIAVDPANVTFPRLDTLQFVEALIAEAAAYDIAQWDATIVADLAVFKPKIQALGAPRGVFDFSAIAGNEYPTLDLQPGYYTYADSGLPNADPVIVVDPRNRDSDGNLIPAGPAPANLPANALVYNVGDRAYWDGSTWRRFAPGEDIPVGVDSDGVNAAIALHERVEAAAESEIERLEGLSAADGCDDGSSFDVVFLGDLSECPGEPENGAVCHYKLNSPIDMVVRLTVRGSGDSTVIERCNPGPCGGQAATGAHRLFNVPSSQSAEFTKITFRGGDAGLENGGAIRAEGSLSMTGVRLEGNRAASGGAIQLEEDASLEMENARLVDNVARTGNGGALNVLGGLLRVIDVVMGEYVADSAAPGGFRLAGNSAAGNGGAIALMSINGGNLTVSGGAYIGNTATRGSAIYVGSEIAVATLENVTLAQNRATNSGTFSAEMPASAIGNFNFNNVTMVENQAAGGNAGLSVNRLVSMQIYNSVIAGNAGVGSRPDCDFAAGVVNSENFRRNYYASPTGAVAGPDDCPGLRYQAVPLTTPVPEKENFELDSTVLLIGDLLNPLDPAKGPFYVPVFPDDVNDSTENRLVNRGAGTQEVSRCSGKDQRGYERSSSVDEECDIGAVEYQIGRRRDDVIEMLVDERRCENVMGDDVGDALYVSGSLRVFDVERAGYTAVVISSNPALWAAELAARYTAFGQPLPANIDTTLDFDGVDVNGDGDFSDAGDTPAACPNYSALLDASGQPLFREVVLVIPAPGFHGQTEILYGMDWQTAGAEPVTGSVTAIARVMTESRGGIQSSSLGSLSPLALLMFACLLALRRLRAGVALLGLLVLSVPASAEENVIYVNSALDEPVVTTPRDGRCTLREALDTARNDRANMSGGDCLDGNEGPDVIEFAPEFVDSAQTTVVLKGTVIAYGNVSLRCPAPPQPLEGQPPVPAQVCGIKRDVADPRQFRLIDSRGSLNISRIIFENGQTPDRGAGQDGGAIYSIGTLNIADTVFRNNTAVSGGAIFLAGASSGLNIIRAVFEGNSSRAGTENDSLGAVVGMTPARAARCPALARGGADSLVGDRLAGGGAIATTQSDGHKIAIQAASFIRNCSVAGAGAVDINTRGSVVIANSTFSGNVSFEGPGAIDVSGALGNATLRNITVMENQSGMARIRETWEATTSSLQRRAVQFGVVGITMTSSIIAANVAESDNTQAANCAPPGGSVGSFYNVFGDEDDGGVVVTPDEGHTCRVLVGSNDRLLYDYEVYDATTTPAGGLMSGLVGVNVNDTTLYMYAIADTVAAAGVLVDAGYTDGGDTASENQVEPVFSSTAKCANVDARGASRESGGRCDIGAFEVLGITAKADSENNVGRTNRLVAVNLVGNDIYDDIGALPEKKIKQDCDTTVVLLDTPVAGARTFRFVGLDTPADADANPDICAEVVVPASEYAAPVLPTDPVPGSGEVVFCYADMNVVAEPRCENAVPEDGYLMVYDNHNVLRDKDLNGLIELSYRAFTVGQVASNPASITLSVQNVPPEANSDVALVGVGSTAVINVLANDRDQDNSSASGLKLVGLSGAGCTAVFSDEDDLETVLYWQCQFGKVTMDPSGNISWTPINTFNPFSEEITYEISDEDPVLKKTTKAVVTFRVDRPVANGGSILGNDDISDLLGLDFLGAPGPLFFLPLLLALARRRS